MTEETLLIQKTIIVTIINIARIILHRFCIKLSRIFGITDKLKIVFPLKCKLTKLYLFQIVIKEKNMQKAIVLLSGGMDSAVTTAIALKKGYTIAALHLNYGQRTQTRELQSFLRLCEYFNITEKLIVDISYLAEIGGSSLTDASINVFNAKLDSKDIPNTYVPFRNANILAIATSWAEVIGATAIYIGANQVDSSGYPDTRKEFFDAAQKMIDFGTKPETTIIIETPIIEMSKNEIINLGNELGVPFELTWSCYRNNDIACGTCDSCALRLKGFDEAGIFDPIEYETRPKY